MIKSDIEWTDTTWSPVIGCTKVSQGCKNCYAEREVKTRWSKNPKSIWYGRDFTDVLCRPEVLTSMSSPLTWKRPRRIFVCPRADLFHEAVPDEFLLSVFAVMAACPQHTFQVLTKRAARMRQLLSASIMPGWPFANVWLGVSVEDQAAADERIPLLLQTPAAVRWISAEPLLGPVDLRRIALGEDLGEDVGGWFQCDAIVTWVDALNGEAKSAEREGSHLYGEATSFRLPSVNWVVAGGESGPKARPSHPDWYRSLRGQCAAAGVPFLFKQWGEWWEVSEGAPVDELAADGIEGTEYFEHGRDCVITAAGQVFDSPMALPIDTPGRWMTRLGKKAAGRLLDGVLHDAYPESAQ